MKKALPLLSFLCGFYLMNAQPITNGGFENWTLSNLYEEPAVFFTTNSWAYQATGVGNVVKSMPSYHGNFAVDLNTVQSATDTVFGGLFLGRPGSGGINGGSPFIGQPDSVSAYVKYTIQPNDTAFFIIAFKNNGSIIGMVFKSFTGSQLTYNRVCMATGLPVSPAPDTIVAIFTSSKLDGSKMPGSRLTLDSISMIGSIQQFPNPSFENWASVSTEEPDNWTSINFASLNGTPSATKTTTSYNGTYALRLEAIQVGGNQTLGFITNGYFGQNGPTGGMQVNANPQKITGYYMYFPSGNDTALAAAMSYYNGNIIDSSMIKLAAQSVYTYFEVPLSYNGWPLVDTLNISFSSRNMLDTITNGLGSVLFLDNISIIYYPVGITENMNSFLGQVYPNPVTGDALIVFRGETTDSHRIEIYDATGKLVQLNGNISGNSCRISKQDLADGIYYYRASNEKSGKLLAGGKFEVR